MTWEKVRERTTERKMTGIGGGPLCSPHVAPQPIPALMACAPILPSLPLGVLVSVPPSAWTITFLNPAKRRPGKPGTCGGVYTTFTACSPATGYRHVVGVSTHEPSSS